MKRCLVLVFMLSCGMWVLSQAQSSGSNGSSQASGGSQTSVPSSGQNGQGGYGQSGGGQSQSRIQGCLMGSSGNYTLTDNKTGTTYQLTGDTSKLSQHVNQSVEIRGNKGSSSSDSSSGAASSGAGSSMGQQTFTVASVKKISSSCSPSSK